VGRHGAVIGIALAAAIGLGRAPGEVEEADVEMSRISGPLESPRRHFRLRHPAELLPAEAERIYRIALRALRVGYAASGHPAGSGYLGWRRHNTAPYLSATHGNHYVNNYANPVASAYGRFEEAGRLPVGSVLAKDSFSLTDTGGILLGSLFVMEKMPPGFHYVTGGWRYTQILPDGTVLGQTKGPGAARVEYCIMCHLARERFDHLYFVPEGHRRSDP